MTSVQLNLSVFPATVPLRLRGALGAWTLTTDISVEGEPPRLVPGSGATVAYRDFDVEFAQDPDPFIIDEEHPDAKVKLQIRPVELPRGTWTTGHLKGQGTLRIFSEERVLGPILIKDVVLAKEIEVATDQTPVNGLVDLLSPSGGLAFWDGSVRPEAIALLGLGDGESGAAGSAFPASAIKAPDGQYEVHIPPGLAVVTAASANYLPAIGSLGKGVPLLEVQDPGNSRLLASNLSDPELLHNTGLLQRTLLNRIFLAGAVDEGLVKERLLVVARNVHLPKANTVSVTVRLRRSHTFGFPLTLNRIPGTATFQKHLDILRALAEDRSILYSGGSDQP